MMTLARSGIRRVLRGAESQSQSENQFCSSDPPDSTNSSRIIENFPGCSKNPCENLSENSDNVENANKYEDFRQEPAFWMQHLENIRQMRSNRDAQVDTMGAHSCVRAGSSEEDKKFQVLLALMLSSQTKDQVTSSAMRRLQDYMKGCSAEKMAAMDQEILSDLIYPVGFYKRKAEYIKKATRQILDKYAGSVPNSYEQLCTLPGVGPKMATLTMSIAFGSSVGIGVDTHVHRVANRLAWTFGSTKTPEATKKALERWVPRSLWEDINLLLVGFGQQICTPLRPKCSTCLNKSICPYAIAHPN